MSTNEQAYGTLPPGEEPAPTKAAEALAHPTEPSAGGVTRASSSDPTPANIRPLGTPLPPQFGRYRIVKQIGRGGMGTVYLAHDTQLGDRPVALKVPLVHPDEQSAYWERFHREAKAAATLNHPNICAVYDVGSLDGVLFLAMAFIEGQALNQRLRTGPSLPPAEVARLVRALALALDEAHQRGVVHRDLKPGNIILNQRGEPVIMDFGLAWVDRGDASRLTETGQVLGTPAYMPPEQVSGDVKAMGPRCDIYSLGVILYELLAGKVPFSGNSAMVLARVLTEEPPPPSSHKPDLDRGLEAICLKAMAKRISNRYASMGELAKALADWSGESSSQSATLLQPPPPQARPRRTGRRLVAVTLLLLLLAGLGGVGWYYQPQIMELLTRPGALASTAAKRGTVAPPPVVLKAIVDASPKSRPITAVEPVRPQPVLVPEPIILRPTPGLLHTVKAVGEKVNSLAFSPDGRLLLSGSGAKGAVAGIQVWDVETGKERSRLDRATGKWVPLQGEQQVGFSAGGTRAWSISDRATVWLWDVQGKDAPHRVESPVRVDGKKNWISTGAMLPDGKFFLCVIGDNDPKADQRLHLMPLFNPDRPPGPLEGATHFSFSLAVAPDGRRAVSGSASGEIIVWDLVERKMWKRLQGGVRMSVRAVRFSADGRRILALTVVGSLIIWDATTGDLLTTYMAPPGAKDQERPVIKGNSWSALSADGQRGIISLSPKPAEIGEHQVWIWDIDKQRLLHRFVCDHTIGCVDISPDGRYAAAGQDDGAIRVWRLEE